MHKRDVLMRQFEEFGKFLAMLIGFKQQGNFEEVTKLINEGAITYLDFTIEEINSTPIENTIQVLTQEKKLTDEELKMLADLLYEKGINDLNLHVLEISDIEHYFIKAQLIYHFVNENATLPYSLDTHYKLESIKDILK